MIKIPESKSNKGRLGPGEIIAVELKEENSLMIKKSRITSQKTIKSLIIKLLI